MESNYVYTFFQTTHNFVDKYNNKNNNNNNNIKEKNMLKAFNVQFLKA